jgi:hypothetical protein
LSRRFPKVDKPHVLRSFTLSKASPGACSTRRSNMNCFSWHVMYCAFTCRVLLIDSDMLHGHYSLSLDQVGPVGDQWNTQKGRARRVLWLFRCFYVVALICVS